MDNGHIEQLCQGPDIEKNLVHEDSEKERKVQIEENPGKQRGSGWTMQNLTE